MSDHKYRKDEFVRNPYNYDAEKLSDQTGLLCEDESLTSQEFVEEADINYIADRFMKTGELPQVPNMPTAGDFEGIFDFQSAMNIIQAARVEFAALPAKIRSRFSNDPAELIKFLEDDDNRQEAIKLGLLEKPKTPIVDIAEDPAKAPVPPSTGSSAPQDSKTKPDTNSQK